MPIRFPGAVAYYHTPLGTPLLPSGTQNASCSFFFRVPSGQGTAARSRVFRPTFNSVDYAQQFRLTASSGNAAINARWHTKSGGLVEYEHTTALDVSHHVVATMSGGDTFKLYLDGRLVFSRTTAGAGGFDCSAQTSIEFGVVAGGTAYDLDDFHLWNNLALTEAEVLSMRDRSGAIPGIPAFALTLDGTAGGIPVINTGGLAITGSSGLTFTAASGSTNLVTYQAEALASPIANLTSTRLAPSRKALAIRAQSPSGQLADIQSVDTVPMIRLNGGPPVTPNPGFLSKNGWLLFTLPFTVGPNDTLTMTVPTDWAFSMQGPVSGCTDREVTNTTDPLYPPIPAGPKSLRLGYGIQAKSFDYPIYTHSNILKSNLGEPSHPSHGTFYYGRWPTTRWPSDPWPAIPSSAALDLTLTRDDQWAYLDTTTGQRSPNMTIPYSGSILVRWDGTSDIQVICPEQPITATEAVIGQTTGNYRRYTWSNHNPSILRRLRLRVFGPGTSNVRVYLPGTLDDDSPKFHPSFLRQLGNAKIIRTLDVTAGHNGKIVSINDFPTSNALSFSAIKQSRLVHFTSIDTFADPTGSCGPWIRMELTSDAPHNLVEGAVIICPSDAAKYTLATSGGNQNFSNYLLWIVGILSPTQVQAIALTNGNKQLLGQSTIDWTIDWSPPGGWPPEETAELCSIKGADLWYTVPYALPDADIAALAEKLISALNPGLKIYCEYGNEAWNSYQAYMGGVYFSTMGVRDGFGPYGFTSKIRWYTKRAAQVHAIFESVMAAHGRAEDLVRVFGSWSTGSNTTQIIVDYAAAHDIKVDAVAVAPYFGAIEPNTSIAAFFDSMDIDQLMDVFELYLYDYPKAEMSSHNTILKSVFPNASLTCYEGAFERMLPGWTGDAHDRVAVNRNNAMYNHPRIRGCVQRYVQSMQEGGVVAFPFFELSCVVGTSTLLDFSRRYAAYTCYDQQAGTGDGSDGQFDNTSDYRINGLMVSPLAMGLNDWMGMTQTPDHPPTTTPRGPQPKRLSPRQFQPPTHRPSQNNSPTMRPKLRGRPRFR